MFQLAMDVCLSICLWWYYRVLCVFHYSFIKNQSLKLFGTIAKHIP